VSRSVRTKRYALAILIPLVLAGCGDDGGGNGGGDGSGDGSGNTVSASDYASTVCTSVQTWLTALQESATAVGSDVVAAGSPEEAQTVLAEYLDGVIADTDALIASVEDAGIPDVEGGEAVAGEILGAFEQARTVFEDARAQVDELPIDDPAAFAAATSELGTSIQTASVGIGQSISGLEQEELSQAFTDEPACSALGS
jgi:hypothetical protein